jgi:hypothetical protein
MQLQRCVWTLNSDVAFLFETRKSPSIEQHQWNKDTCHFCCIKLSIYRPSFRAISGYDGGELEAFALLPPYTVYCMLIDLNWRFFDFLTLEMELTCPETSVHKYQHTLRKSQKSESLRLVLGHTLHLFISFKPLFHHTVHNEAFCITGHTASHTMCNGAALKI